jgi:hypothetical protein
MIITVIYIIHELIQIIIFRNCLMMYITFYNIFIVMRIIFFRCIQTNIFDFLKYNIEVLMKIII